jgi:sigma-B regulation protein RsbU (phosphoserine phosphatase)
VLGLATEDAMTTGGSYEAFSDALSDDDPETLYEQAPCGYVSTTPDGLIVKVNQTFLALTGYRRAELVGVRTFAQLLTAGGRIYHETHYAPMLRMQGRAREIALEIVRADGKRVPVLVNAVLDHHQDGSPRAVRAAIFDATERRNYERELLLAKEMAERSEARATALARTLQQTLIPPTPPHIPGLDVAARYRPAGAGDEVGGDFYDVAQLGPDEWMIAIGDVRGKGIEAAIVTALARYTLRAAMMGGPEPSMALRTLNEVLLAEHVERFCTVALARVSLRGDGCHITLSVGGHPLPLLRAPGHLPTTVGTPGTLLGVLAEPELTDTETILRPGDVLVLFTDGVTEGRRDRDFYGDERLAATINEAPADSHQLADHLLADLLRFQREVPADDIALVVLQPQNARKA